MNHFIEEWKKKDPKSKMWMAGGVLFLPLAIVGLVIPIVPPNSFRHYFSILFFQRQRQNT